MKKYLFNPFMNSIMMLPTPININYMWNFGSLLGFSMMIQILSGLLISMNYCPNILYAFNSIIHIIQNVNYGWLIHNIHMNGASMFFIFMYLHLSRGLYYNSYILTNVWMIGVTIFLLSMITAFLGYVLPWGQMSFWGATVITNLLSVIPFIGTNIVQWIWGGFSINNATLSRFYTLHFIMPFMIIMLIILHIYFLHFTGSLNPLGTNSNMNKIPFNIYFYIKDLFLILLISMMFMIIILLYPYILSDPDNFLPSNPMITPIHIQPEWYFLYAYAILRSIPNKLGGVIALLSSILILYFLPLIKMNTYSSNNYPMNQIMFWMLMNIFIILTWLGAQPIEYPYLNLIQFMSIMFFLYFFSLNPILKFWNYLIYNN